MVFLPRMSYDPCIGLMIMNTLLALHLNTIGANTGKYIHPLFDLTADILYEFRMVIGVFGDILLVRPLQQSIERRGGRLLRDLHILLKGDKFVGIRRNGDQCSLIMGGIVGNFF